MNRLKNVALLFCFSLAIVMTTGLVFAEGTPLQILTYQIPTSVTGASYSVTLEASGGTVPYTWSVVEGSVPAWLTLNPATGELYGTPVTHEKINFVVQVTDSLGEYATQRIWGYIIDAYEWVQRYPLESSSALDGATGIAADSNGNVFVTGYDQMSLNQWDSLVYAVTVKYDAAGNLLWSRTYDTGNYTRAEAITVDGQGNAYVAGYYSNGLESFDWFVVKYDPSGNLIKTITYNATGENKANGIAVDTSGNIYVTGSTSNKKDTDVLTVKYDVAGNQKWAKTYDGGNDDAGRAVSADGSGNVYLAASTNNGTDDDFLVIKYANNGRALWTKIANQARDVPAGIGTDSVGNVYVGGVTEWGDYPYNRSDTLIVNYGPSGDLLWERSLDLGGFHDKPSGLVVAPNGNFYISMNGYKIELGDALAYKFDSSGNEIWLKVNIEGGTSGIALDNAGYVYIGSTTSVSGSTGYMVVKYQDLP